MRLLADTHAFLWWLSGAMQLSATARYAMADMNNEVFISAASAWEITTKHRLGKLPHASLVAADVRSCIHDQAFAELPISVRHAQAGGALPGPNRDPFDRILIAQSMLEDLTLVSIERTFDAYGVKR